MIYAVNIPYSNTTLVKVKLIRRISVEEGGKNSNTTLVKVKQKGGNKVANAKT